MDRKLLYQYLTASALLLSGVLLSYIGFYTEPRGEISNSVQWYFGECLIWAGSVFGITSYVDWKTTNPRDKRPAHEEATDDQPTRWAKRRQATNPRGGDRRPAHALGEGATSDQPMRWAKRRQAMKGER